MEIFRRKEEPEARLLSLAMPMIDDKQDAMSIRVTRGLSRVSSITDR